MTELVNVKARWDLPWCIGGDFNLVRFAHEREIKDRTDLGMDRFDEFINRWSLIDGPLKGAKYTWSNFIDKPSLSRLDRFLYSNDWEELFPGRSQLACSRSVSDHVQILLQSYWGIGGPSPFKFENTWLLEPDFMEMVKEIWVHSQYLGNPSRLLALKLQNLKHRLKDWNKLSAGFFKESCKRCMEIIDAIDRLEEIRILS